MEKQEWQGYVQKVASCDYPIPLNLINDYDDWKCRSNVGRMLMILKDIEGAMHRSSDSVRRSIRYCACVILQKSFGA